MDPDVATRLFEHDAQRLERVAAHFRLRNVQLVAPRVLTYLLRHRGNPVRVVIMGGDHYYVDPTSVGFANPEDANDRDKKWWPRNVTGINPDQPFVCSPGFAEGHRQHAAWPVSTRKNQIESLTQALTFILKAEPWPETPT